LDVLDCLPVSLLSLDQGSVLDTRDDLKAFAQTVDLTDTRLRASVRKQFPGAYVDLTDEDLGRRARGWYSNVALENHWAFGSPVLYPKRARGRSL
jgi:hypothetical protein